MYLKQLKVNNFRNYDNLTLNLSPFINIFYGDNAQGKTNLLEAIYFLGLSKSIRCTNNENLIKLNTETSNVSGVLEINDDIIKMFIGFDKLKKIKKINEQNVNKIKDYNSYMNIIFFGPDDLNLIKGNPDVRRKYLNIQLSQMSTSYMKILDDYNKLLKIRNEYLEKADFQFDKSYFEVLTIYLIERAVNICRYRRNYIEKINKIISEIFYKITNLSNFKIKYIPSFDFDFDSENIKEKVLEKYKKIYEEEKQAKKTLIGPHKDEFEYLLNNNNLKYYGSQGQQRMSVISLKLAEIEIFKYIKKSTPIILLDDVFSELDDKKKNNLLQYIDNTAQVIITTTDLNNIDENIIKHANVMKICNGNIEEVK